jgi:hypothetical protein
MKSSFALPLLLLGAAGHGAIALAQSPGTFMPTGSMSTPRMDHTATLLPNGKVLIAGGDLSNSIDSISVSASAELYDPATRAFTPTGSMTIPRSGHTAMLVADGKVLIVGGNSGKSATAELYDPSTGTFTPTGSMTSPRAFSATLLADGRVLATGCVIPCSNPSLYVPGTNAAVAELYDPTTGSFATIGTPPGPPDYARGYVSTLLADNRVLITGGCQAQVFDPATGMFSVTGGMAAQCSCYCADPFRCSFYYYTATLLADAKILFVGSGEDAPVDVELYDPAAGTFVSLSTIGLDYSTATLMPDGTVLLTGSDGAGLYMPMIGSLTLAGEMNELRNSHTSTLLPDGTVLLAGGTVFLADGLLAATASAEVYRPGAPISPPVLLSVPGDGRGQGTILHAGTSRLASSSDPAVAGEYLEIYLTGLIDGNVIPPQVSIGGRMAEVSFFGAAGYAGLNQVNVRVPGGVAPGDAVPVRLTYLGRPSNEVTIGLR